MKILKKQSLEICKITALPPYIIKKLKDHGYEYLYEVQKTMVFSNKIDSLLSKEEINILNKCISELDEKYVFEEKFIRFICNEGFMEKTWQDKYELYCRGFNSMQIAKIFKVNSQTIIANLINVERKYAECCTLSFLPLSRRAYRCLLRANLKDIQSIIKAFETGDILKIRNCGIITAEEIAIAIDRQEGTNLVSYLGKYKGC